MPNVKNILAAIKRTLTTPVDELSRVQFRIRHAIELVFFCGRKMREDRATQMAAALTYRTIFSLVPLTVLALLIFKAFGGFAALGDNTQQKIYDYLGINFATQSSQVEPTPETTSTTSASPTHQPNQSTTPNHQLDITDDETQNETQETVVTFFDNLNAQVSNINLAGFGAIGIGVLIWGAVSLLVTAERSFNTIYQCPTGRAWHMRITIYWAIITLGPVLLFISSFVATQAFNFATSIPGLATLFSILSTFTALITTWLLLLALYMLMPNTRVAFKPALIGSFVAAVLWELGKLGFRLYVTKALSAASLNVALYGSLGLILIFLLWIYITWLIIVFGLEITSTLQLLPGRRLKELLTNNEQDPVASPDLIILVMAAIAKPFSTGQTISAQSLAQSLHLTTRTLAHVTNLLLEHNLIHHISENESHHNQFVPARPPQEIPISLLLTLGHEQTKSRIIPVAPTINHNEQTQSSDHTKNTKKADANTSSQLIPGSTFLDQLIDAQISAASAKTLADII
ncbi:YihY/virulence factor BrkB family protein [Poriferisphaera sp. WC338]|uniref:YihY/virulence factor BrkB family protein n=1 Tax=Poriferisphaera sp. WC338 TaxID=3425129 RepID=UPI003D81814E